MAEIEKKLAIFSLAHGLSHLRYALFNILEFSEGGKNYFMEKKRFFLFAKLQGKVHRKTNDRVKMSKAKKSGKKSPKGMLFDDIEGFVRKVESLFPLRV